MWATLIFKPMPHFQYKINISHNKFPYTIFFDVGGYLFYVTVIRQQVFNVLVRSLHEDLGEDP